MKNRAIALLSIVAAMQVATCDCLAQEADAADEAVEKKEVVKASDKLSSLGAGGGKSSFGKLQPPTDEEVLAFVLSTPIERNEGYKFAPKLGQVTSLDRAARNKYAKKGTIPFIASCRFSTVKLSGKNVSGTLEKKGTVNIVLVNGEGEVVYSKRASLNELYVHKSKGSQVGGVTGEVPAPGEYTAYMWMKSRGYLFGKRFKVSFTEVVAPAK